MATMTMEQYQKKMTHWAKTQPKTLKISLKKAAEVVRGESIKKHLSGPKMPVGKGSAHNATLARGSGDLAGSLNTKVKVSGTKVKAKIGTNLKYARIHEKGGVIKPKNGKFLKFNIGGRDIFVKSVTIIKRSFLAPALEEKRKEIDDIILNGMMEAYKKS